MGHRTHVSKKIVLLIYTAYANIVIIRHHKLPKFKCFKNYSQNWKLATSHLRHNGVIFFIAQESAFHYSFLFCFRLFCKSNRTRTYYSPETVSIILYYKSELSTQNFPVTVLHLLGLIQFLSARKLF